MKIKIPLGILKFKDPCIHNERGECAGKAHVKGSHKKWLGAILLFPWTPFILGSWVLIRKLIDLAAHALGMGCITGE